MLDLTVYKTRYYEIKIGENNIVHLETPKKKQLKVLLNLTKKVDSKNLTEEDMDALFPSTSDLLFNLSLNENIANRHIVAKIARTVRVKAIFMQARM